MDAYADSGGWGCDHDLPGEVADAVLIGPLAWQLPYVLGVALNMQMNFHQ